eukprot:4139408-Amphidinium_carterae.2
MQGRPRCWSLVQNSRSTPFLGHNQLHQTAISVGEELDFGDIPFTEVGEAEVASTRERGGLWGSEVSFLELLPSKSASC